VTQNEIYDYLRNEFIMGNRRFFSVRELARHFDIDYSKAHKDIIKLYAYGYLELLNPFNSRRLYRIKASVVGIRDVVSPLDKNITISDFRAIK